ncbi:MAG: restriction endonuclease subunit S [Ignavibacteria bacterium]
MSKNNESKFVPKYRFSEFADSGEWEEKQLGEIGEFIGGGTPDTSVQEYWNGEIQWFTPTEIKEKNIKRSLRTITQKGLQNSSAKLLPNGTLLITTRATIGDVGIAIEECTTNQGFQSLVVNDTENNLFWYYWITQHKNELKRKSSGSTFPEIGKNEIIKIKAFSPNKDEQKKIADCLSSLDDVITAESQKLQVLKEHKKGLLQNIFPQEGETVPKLRFKEFEDSGEWEKKKLWEVATFVNEKTPLENLSINTYISTENILPDYAGVIISSKLPVFGNFTKYRKGDLLISNIRPYLKKVWFADKNGACSNDVIVIRANVIVSDIFLSGLLKNDAFIGYIMKGAEGVKMPRGDKDSIKEFVILFPKNKSEQQKIADCLLSLDEIITAQSQRVEALKLHKKGLLQGLFPNIDEQ